MDVYEPRQDRKVAAINRMFRVPWQICFEFTVWVTLEWSLSELGARF